MFWIWFCLKALRQPPPQSFADREEVKRLMPLIDSALRRVYSPDFEIPPLPVEGRAPTAAWRQYVSACNAYAWHVIEWAILEWATEDLERRSDRRSDTHFLT
jgi:hypothetical protein